MRIKGYSFAEVAEAFGLTEEEVRNDVNSKKRIPVCDENGNARLYDGNGKEIDPEARPTPAEVMFNPELHMRVRKYISADTPEELERYTGILYAKKIEFRCLVYSENSARDWSDDGFRVDILMNYKSIDEPEILKALGLKWHQLYDYFPHS